MPDDAVPHLAEPGQMHERQQAEPDAATGHRLFHAAQGSQYSRVDERRPEQVDHHQQAAVQAERDQHLTQQREGGHVVFPGQYGDRRARPRPHQLT